jgi:hypothetical protein
MARGKSLVKRSAVERATSGLLAAAAAAGVTGDIEVDIVRGLVRFHVTSDSETTLPAETSEQLRKLL